MMHTGCFDSFWCALGALSAGFVCMAGIVVLFLLVFGDRK